MVVELKIVRMSKTTSNIRPVLQRSSNVEHEIIVLESRYVQQQNIQLSTGRVPIFAFRLLILSAQFASLRSTRRLLTEVRYI